MKAIAVKFLTDMKNILKFMFFISLLLVTEISYAHDIELLNELQIQCDKDKAELISTRVVPESCKRLNEKNEEYKNSQENEEMTYEWNGYRYCFFNKKREPVSCF